IRAASCGRVAAVPERAAVEQDGSGGSAEAELRLRYPGIEDERWLLREAWWADSFLSPSYRDLVSWSVRALPWSIGIHIAQRYWQAREGSGRRIAWTAYLIA